MRTLDKIAKDVEIIRSKLVEKTPSHFDIAHIITAFFGALFFGFTFVLKGLLVQIGTSLTRLDLIFITIATWIILTAEIYFVGYKRVPNKHQRPFTQFWLKRITTYYSIALFTSWLLLTLYNLDYATGEEFYKLVIAISFPASIGAAVSDLLGKY